MSSSSNSPTPEIRDLQVTRSEGPYQLETYQQADSIGYLLKRCYSQLSQAMDKQLAPYDLTHPQFMILLLLSKHHCITAADLAREAQMDTGATTRMLDRLEAKGIIRRERSEEDRRRINLVLTDPGRQAAEKMPVAAINVLNDHLKHFDAEEISMLTQLLKKLIDPPADPVASNDDADQESQP